VFLVADLSAGHYCAQQYNCIDKNASKLGNNRIFLPILLPVAVVWHSRPAEEYNSFPQMPQAGGNKSDHGQVCFNSPIHVYSTSQ
jgi:hypothetical protein